MTIKIGMIGTDSSHVVAFPRIINDINHPFHVTGGQVTHVVRYCSEDFELSYSREKKFSDILEKELGLSFVTIDELAKQVDAFMLEAADGRTHLSLFKQLIQYNKPVFIDKPLATSLEEAKQIVTLAKQYNVPIMSSSALRFSTVLQRELAKVNLNHVKKVIVKCPLNIEPTQSRYYWYVVHGVDILYTILGEGCKSVYVELEEDKECLVGKWDNNVIGEVHCIASEHQSFEVSLQYEQGETFISLADHEHNIPFYASLVEQMLLFFSEKRPLISYEEMLEVIWFIEQAEQHYYKVKG